MKKKILLTALVLCCVLLLGGCACEHEWLEATCTTPNVCSLCEETEGVPLGHSWLAATCTAPKTCEICSETEGEALGHNCWKLPAQPPSIALAVSWRREKRCPIHGRMLPPKHLKPAQNVRLPRAKRSLPIPVLRRRIAAASSAHGLWIIPLPARNWASCRAT